MLRQLTFMKDRWMSFDDWKNETIDVKNLVFDTARCSAYLHPDEPGRAAYDFFWE